MMEKQREMGAYSADEPTTRCQSERRH